MQHPLNMFLIIIGENNHQKYFSTAQYNSSLYSLIISLGVFTLVWLLSTSGPIHLLT